MFFTRFYKKIRTLNKKTFLRFCVVGTIGYLVNWGALIFFSRFNFPEFAIWVFAVECAIISNFILNNIWTFATKEIFSFKSTMRQFYVFNGTSAGALAIQSVFGTLGTYLFGETYRWLILLVVTVCIVVPYNWYMYTRVVWKQKDMLIQ
jgi:dolichol-phosphate mannosyltransferase